MSWKKLVLIVMMVSVVITLVVGTSMFAVAGKPPAAPKTYVFKLLAERNLTSAEITNPSAAVAATTTKIMSQIDKSGGSWVVLPNGNSPDGRSLKMPSPGPNKFAQIIEIYSYAVDGCILNHELGKFTVALPWEYSVYTDDSGKIRVNMLVPLGVVKLMSSDPSCQEATAKSIEDNMTSWVVSGLGKGWTFPKQYYGPELSEADVAQARQMVYAPELSIPVPNGVDASVYTANIKNSITDAINAYKLVEPTKWHVTRGIDFAGGSVSDSYSLELCSPYYATQALSMGIHHAPALPCQVGVWHQDGSVKVNILDPNFIFAWFFRDALANMTPEEQAMFAQLPVQVMDEIKNMVNEGIDEYTDQRF